MMESKGIFLFSVGSASLFIEVYEDDHAVKKI